jgi:hypothetical protein
MYSPTWNRFLMCLMGVRIILRNGFWNCSDMDIVAPQSLLQGTRLWWWCCIQFRCLEMWYCLAAWVRSKCWEPLAQWCSIVSNPSFHRSVALEMWYCVAAWVRSKCWEPLAQWLSMTSNPSPHRPVTLLSPLGLATLRRRLHSSLRSAHLLHPRIPRICDVSLWMTPYHFVLGFPTGLVLWNFPLRTSFEIVSSSIFITW